MPNPVLLETTRGEIICGLPLYQIPIFVLYRGIKSHHPISLPSWRTQTSLKHTTPLVFTRNGQKVGETRPNLEFTNFLNQIRQRLSYKAP